MQVIDYNQLWMVGLPIWILTIGGLLCLLLDSFIKKSSDILYAVGALTFILALFFGFNQWTKQQTSIVDLLVMDSLSLFFLFLVTFIGLISLLNSYSYIKVGGSTDKKINPDLPGAVVSLILFSVVGQIFLFCSDHLIINFIGLEVMSLAVYVLVGSKKHDLRSNEATIKYFIMGSVASAILLYGIALIYGSLGTLRLSGIVEAALNPELDLLTNLGIALLLAGIFFKLALAPFHFWVPDVYEGAPAPITGFMSTGVKVASVAFFIRILVSSPFLTSDFMIPLMSVLIVLTLLVGNLGAIIQDNVKRMLAYSSISHAGYILLGLMSIYKDGQIHTSNLQPVLFYLLTYSLMGLGSFAVLSVLVSNNKEINQFSQLTGLGYRRPVLAAVFSLFMLSLLGMPPTAGFVAKYGIFSQAINNGYIGLSIFGIITSVISAYYYLRPLVAMYFKGEGEKTVETNIPLPLMFALVFCAVAIIFIGLVPSDYLQMTRLALLSLK